MTYPVPLFPADRQVTAPNGELNYQYQQFFRALTKRTELLDSSNDNNSVWIGQFNITEPQDKDVLIYDSLENVWKNVDSVEQVAFTPNINVIEQKSGDLDCLTYLRSIPASCSEPRDLFITQDGTKMFLLDNGADNVLYFTLSTPFDLSTAVYTTITFSVAAQVTAPYGLSFSADGTKMYVTGFQTIGTLWQYALATPWDITTATFTGSITTSFTASGAHAITFSPDGTKAFLADNANDQIYQYTLPIPWDMLSSVITTKFINVGVYTSTQQGISFSPDGLKIYCVDGDNRQIVEFTLGTAYDLGTWSFTNKRSINNIKINVVSTVSPSGASGLCIRGNNFYISDYTSDTVMQFTIDAQIVNVRTKQTVFQSDVEVKGVLRVTDWLTTDVLRARSLDIYGVSTFANTTSFTGSVVMSATTGTLSLGASLTTGSVTLGGTNQTGSIFIGGTGATGNIVLGRSNGTQSVNIAIGGTSSGNTKTINIGTGGVAGSTTTITVGSAASTTTMSVLGSFTATTKAFTIAHPTKQGYKLRYGSLESPYHGIQLTGSAEIPKDKLWVDVELPDYFSSLVHEDSIHIQLTAKNHFNPMCVGSIDFKNNTFRVFTKAESFDYSSTGYGFYWSLTAERKDVDRLQTEFEGD